MGVIVQFQQYSENEMKDFFRSNLVIKDPKAKNYVVDMLIRFAYAANFGYVFSEHPLSVEMNDLFESSNKAYAFDAFRDTGDAILWLCGFFPKTLSRNRSHKKKGMGLEWYVQKGRFAYNSAIDIGNMIRAEGSKIIGMSRVSNGFENCSRSLLEMRVRLNKGAETFNPELMDELSKAFYKGEDAAAKLAEIAYREMPILRVVPEPEPKYTKKFS